MHTTEQKYNDLIKFSNHDLSLKEEELFTTLKEGSPTALAWGSSITSNTFLQT